VKDPNNLTALAILVSRCEGAGLYSDPEIAECNRYALQGLGALDANQPNISSQALVSTRENFASWLGISALQKNEYPEAQRYLQMAEDLAPGQYFGVVYSLALAYLNAPKPNCEKGLWYIARATHLAAISRYSDLNAFGQKKTVEFHGKEAQWKGILKQASRSSTPPAGFVINCSAK